MAGRKTKGSRRTARTEQPSQPLGLTPSQAWSLASLSATAAVCGLLAVYQWMELLGDGSSFCSINEVLNCSAVWQAPLAKQWQALTGVPVAGWGLLWALLALMAGVWAVGARLQRGDGAAPAAAVQLVAVAGVVTAILLGGYSLSLGQICLTCWTTYALVGAYAGLAWFLSGPVFPSRPDGRALQAAALPLAIAGVVAFVGLRWPGAHTPIPGEALVEVTAPVRASRTGPNDRPLDAPSDARSDSMSEAGKAPQSAVGEYLSTLPETVRRNVLQGLEAYRVAERPALPDLGPRPYLGAAAAPIRITDFSDLRCPHCASLARAMEQIARQIPKEAVRFESRYFPLDAECNPRLSGSDGTHVRCTAAKTLICSQDHERYEELRQRMFRAQSTLTVARVRELATEVLGRSVVTGLDDCLASEDTKAKLAEDIDYAARFDIRGTPMVVMNGRQVLAYPPLLLALVLADGDPNHAAFDRRKASLPSPDQQR